MKSSSALSLRPRTRLIKAATLSMYQTTEDERNNSGNARMPWTMASNSSCAILVGWSDHKSKMEESMVITAPQRNPYAVCSNTPAFPWRGASWLASEAAKRWPDKLGWSSTTRRGCSSKMASIRLKARCNSAVRQRSEEYWRSLIELIPARATWPKVPWSRKVKQPYNLLAWPGSSVAESNACDMMSWILVAKRGRIHKRMSPWERTADKSWTKPKKSLVKLGGCCFSVAKGYPKSSQTCWIAFWVRTAEEVQSWDVKSSK